MVVAGVVAEVVGGEEKAARELPQTVAPDFASPVYEAAVYPAARPVDLAAEARTVHMATVHKTIQQRTKFHETIRCRIRYEAILQKSKFL